MAIKSVSGFALYVQDVQRSVDFYHTLGFRLGEVTDTYARVYLNWFAIDFVAISSETKEEFLAEATAEPKGSGMYINISVDDVDATYEFVKEQGMVPSSEPRDWPSGNREFAMRDPDGYKLVFFKEK